MPEVKTNLNVGCLLGVISAQLDAGRRQFLFYFYIFYFFFLDESYLGGPLRRRLSVMQISPSVTPACRLSGISPGGRVTGFFY